MFRERSIQFSNRAFRVSVWLVLVPTTVLVCVGLFADFVTAPEWNRISVWPALAWGLVWSVLSLPTVIGLWRTIPRRAFALRARLISVFIPILIGFFGWLQVKDGLPFLFAALFGAQAELDVTIARNWENSRYCRDEVAFYGAGPFFGRVCGLSDERRAELYPSARVKLMGHGTRYGLFVSGIELMP